MRRTGGTAETNGVMSCRRKRMNGEVIATTGETLVEDDEHVFLRDTATDDTRVRTAASWLGRQPSSRCSRCGRRPRVAG